ncbi:MAG: glycosyltransferase family 39 protein [Candidatus Hydrogenedentota bacterium]
MKTKLFLLLISAFIFRLILLYFFYSDDYLCDELEYHLLAKNLVSGIGYSLDNISLTTYRNPGFPFFLSVVYKLFSSNILIVKIIQCLFNSFASVIVFLIAKIFFDEKIALLSGYITSFHPVIGIYATQLYSESFYTIIFLVGIYFFIKAFIDVSTYKIYIILAGIFCGLCLLTRTSTLFYFLPLTAGYFIIYKDKRILKMALLFSTIILLLIPWTIRNYKISGKIQPFGSGIGGIVFFIATYLPWKGDNPGYDKEPLKTYMERFKNEELDSFLYKEGINNIKKWPLQYLIMSIKRIRPLWFTSHSAIFGINLPNKTMLEKKLYHLIFIKIILFVFNCLLILSNVFYYFINKDKIKEHILFLLLILGFSLHIFLAVTARYTVPYLPLSIILFSSMVYRIKYYLPCSCPVTGNPSVMGNI